MADSLLIACDLHNTLLRADAAWQYAFASLTDKTPAEIRRLLDTGTSRHILAEQLVVKYEDVYSRYYQVLRPDDLMADIVSLLQDRYPVVLISAAKKERVEKDLLKLNGKIRFDSVYTQETFCKSSGDDWALLKETYGCERILYVGNDPEEDIIPVPFVQSLLVPATDRERRCDDR